jgi:hypothetical protein
MLYLVCHNELVSLITVGVELYQKLSRNLILLDPVVCRYLKKMLTLIFQKTIDEGEVPSNWKYANVTALFKKGGRFKASNYRSVSLTCLCCKFQ